MIEFLQFLVPGILIGGVYALLASGLGLIFGVMRVVNFAQADFMMLAMYLSWALFAGGIGMDPFIAAPIVFGAFFVLGMAVHGLFVRHVIGRRENHDAQVVLTIGLGLIFQNLILIRYSSEPRVVAPSYANDGDYLGEIFVSRVRLYAFGLSLLVAALLFLFLNRTRTGRAIRAASENWEAATYMGVDINRTNRIAFGVGTALTAVGGCALVTFQSITPFVGLRFVVVMFAAVVLGGLGSVGGAFVGGVLIGIVQSVSQVWTSAAVKNVWVFALFLLILYVRPNGLFGKVQRAI